MRTLIVVNAALLGALAFVTLAPAVAAQGFRSRGEYHMVAGGVVGLQADLVYIVDDVNEQMIVLTYDPNTHTMKGVGGRDLAADAGQFNRSRP
jgi:hypothetical protein